MQIYLSSMRSCVLTRYKKCRPDDRPNILVSYANLGGDTSALLEMRKQNEIDGVILDSGTYSKHHSSRQINLESYIEYLKLLGNDFDMYFNFDTDFSDSGFSIENLENLEEMRKAGLNPIPVVHDVESGETEYFTKEGCPIIALGSSQTSEIETLDNFFEQISHCNVKVHLLGVSEYEKLVKYPVHSCDSSTWNKALIPGYLYWWNPLSTKLDKTERVYFGGVSNRSTKSVPHYIEYNALDELNEYLDKYLGMTRWDLLGYKANQNLQIANLYYFRKLEEVITQEHIRLGY